MSNSGIKISGLTSLTSVPEFGVIPIANKEGKETFGATLTNLRSAMLFENAYATLEDGIANEDPGNIFFVYNEAERLNVRCWRKVSGGATPVIDGDGQQVIYPTWNKLKAAVLAEDLASTDVTQGSNVVGWKRAKNYSDTETVAQALNSNEVSIWEYADRITNKPNAIDPTTWDWAPALQAASNDNVAVILEDGFTYKVLSPLTYANGISTYNGYARFPKCPSGLAVLDYSAIANAGAGWTSGVPVDDVSQPAYTPFMTITGGSGVLTLQTLEGIVFKGNSNTAAIKIIGACGISPRRLIFDNNRFGIIFNNGLASGTYTEICKPVDCRWRSGCVTAISYEKGSGDTSFHGSGLGEGCYITTPAGYSPILIGAGCQPYHAPLNANIWMSGITAPVIQNKSSLAAHFHGNVKLEASFKTPMATGTNVYLYGTLSTWSGVDKGSLFQSTRGGPTGPSGGNLAFSGVLTPTITRYDVALAGTPVIFMSYNDEATVTVSGATYYATFKLTSSRRLAANPINSPILLINGNVNPMTKFSITRQPGGMQLVTLEDATVIMTMRQQGLPDQSSGVNFTSADYWRTL